MALDAEVAFRVQREIRLEIGAVQFMAAGADQGSLGARIFNIAPHRMGTFVGVFMTAAAEIFADTLEILRIIAAVRSMAIGAIHAAMGDVLVPGLAFVLIAFEMATET